ncbi:hypothetical protein PoMZ_04585 [Pyricularia oryzae]|uniref:Secreted protein n=1 Tax=Pyricularia oryzae TaxID=318829 RepID=A0A4P7NAL7_PYROR|nr:hypothetical protein PoMZ_04585 [Pyricularia oryzae]
MTGPSWLLVLRSTAAAAAALANVKTTPFCILRVRGRRNSPPLHDRGQNAYICAVAQ